MTGTDLQAWRERMGLSLNGAAAALGVKRDTFTGYERGLQPVPIYIDLACQQLAQRKGKRLCRKKSRTKN